MIGFESVGWKLSSIWNPDLVTFITLHGIILVVYFRRFYYGYVLDFEWYYYGYVLDFGWYYFGYVCISVSSIMVMY